MKKIISTSILCILFNLLSLAQDNWTPVVGGGFDNIYNRAIKSTKVFNGKIYAGTGNDSASVYSSSSGDPGTWQKVYTEPGYSSIEAMATIAEGTGRIYLSEASYSTPIQKVLKSDDGLIWLPYFNSINNRIKHIIPFNGTGVADSIYIVIDAPNGDMILKSSYDSSDPDNLSGSWDTVLNFDQLYSFERINCISECNNKLFFGTNYAQLYSSLDGNTWTINSNVGAGFSNINNYELTAIGSLGTYIYVGTKNYVDGPQIWRSNDEIVWDSVMQFSSTQENVTALNTIASNLWVTTYAFSFNAQKIFKTSDGINYVNSNNNGFGYDNNGMFANIILFGNNIYSSCENYFPGLSAVSGINTQNQGGQIWRLCNFTPAPLSVTPASYTFCSGSTTPPAFTASGGFTNYMWDSSPVGSLTSFSFTGSGQHFITAVDLNGCSSYDTVSVNLLPAPATFTSVGTSPALKCYGDTLNIGSNNSSNLRTNLPAFASTNSIAIFDGGTSIDSITVSGVIDDGLNNTLVSVTIDSLFHTDNGDLTITLFAPDGSSMNLVNYSGAGSQNYIGTVFSPTASTYVGSSVGPFTGTFAPWDPFYYLSGSTNGVWKIQIYDNINLNTGFLKGWSLNFSEVDTNMTYLWSPSTGLSSTTSANIYSTANTSTNYTLTVTNALGCSTTADTVKLIVPTIDITPSPATVCYGSSATLTATGGVNYYWAPATFLSATLGSNVNTNATSNIMYYVNDTVGGCVIMDSVYVTANPQLFVTASLPQTICFGTNATLTATGSGGTPGYTYNWNDGATNTPGQNIVVSPTSATTYTLTALDTNGCFASDFTSVSVTPSTDLVGHAGYSGGNVTSGNAVAFRYYPTYTYFDTVQVTSLDGLGNFTFTALNSGDYLIKIFADTLLYPTLNATYFGDTWAWDTATVVTHGCSAVDTANVTMVEELGLAGGPGNLRGRIIEDIGFGSMATWGSGMGRAPGEPIPGIDVKLGKNPGGAMMGSTTTSSATASDGGGFYYFTNVPLNAVGGSYTVYVDIPGLGRDSSYTVVLDAVTNQYIYLDYIVDSTMIYIVPNAGVGISNPDVAVENKFGVYPNPSKGNATIEYSLATDATVSLSVYNVLGVKISELVNEEQKSGKHKYSINEINSPLNAGVYFITLISNGKTSTQRLIISE